MSILLKLGVNARENRLPPPNLLFALGNQSIYFLLDVNSAETFVISNKVKGIQRGFNPSKSPTFIDLKTPLNGKYDNVVNDRSSSVQGTIVQDSIQFYFDFPKKNVTFALVDKIDEIPTIAYEKDTPRSGRMGIMAKVPTRKTDLGKIQFGEPFQRFGFYALCQQVNFKKSIYPSGKIF